MGGHGSARPRGALYFLAELHATPEFDGEKIDVVLWSPALHAEPLPIHRVALAQGVEL